MAKPPVLSKIAFWAQFVSAIGSLVLKDGDTKQQVINIANGVSATASTVQQAEDAGML